MSFISRVVSKVSIASVIALTLSASIGFAKSSQQLENNEIKAGDAISVWASSVKDKDKKFDLSLNLRNLSTTDGLIVMFPDMSCKRGEVKGSLRYPTFGSKGQTLALKPEETKNFTVVCDLPTVVKGEYSIILGKVYANPTNDGYTQGKVLADTVVWKTSDIKK